MEQEKTCVFKRKMKKTNWKSWKKIGDEKPKFFLGVKKTKAKTNQRRETRREKVKEEERFVRREQKEVVQKGSEKTFFFSKINAKRKNENIICPRREDTFFQQKGF